MSLTAQSVTPAQPNHTSGNSTQAQARAKLADLPLGFEPNRGQWDPQIKYAAKASRYSVFLTSSEAVFVLPEQIELPTSLKAIAAQTATQHTNHPSRWTSVSMRLVGSNPDSSILVADQLSGRKNYYVGRDKSKWAQGVPLYGRLEEHEVYPGIDLAFRGADKQLEFDFVLNPGADARQIKLSFRGARHVRIDHSGNLILSSTAGNLEMHQPVAYQEMPDGTRKSVEARFKRHNNEVHLALGYYDRQKQLVIDPSVTYSTYLGGDGLDEGLGIAVAGGNAYIAGATASPNFPCVPAGQCNS
jgi:hypothetical protein